MTEPAAGKQESQAWGGASLGPESLAALTQLQMLGEETTGDGEMIYLLVDDGTDPNLDNQTLYIDPSQLAAATGGMLTLGSDMGGGPMIIQGYGGAGPLVLQTSSQHGGQMVIQGSEGQVHLVMPDKVLGEVPQHTSTLGLVTSADTSGGIATLPAHPSSSLLAQVPLITTPAQQGPIMVSSTKTDPE